jgi:hypothetical protein
VFCVSIAAYKTEVRFPATSSLPYLKPLYLTPPNQQVTYTLSSPDVMKVYADGSPLSGNVIERSWCGTCGSRVKNARTSSDMVAVPTGIIDGDKGGELKPGMELFCANREEWAGEVQGAKSFVGMPPPQPAAK